MTRTALARAPRRGRLTKYDPDRGLKTIAFAEAAEKHWARAKDATKLEHAIRAKLEAQAEFVLWWDTQGPGTDHGAGRGNKKVSDPKSFLPNPVTVHRWRRKLNDPDKFEQTYTAAVARYVKILELQKTAHVAQNSGDNEWYTPKDYINAARDVLGGIDLDPATSDVANETIKATRFFTLKDNGLDRPWRGRVWMNPPYAQPLIEQFCAKLADSVRSGDVTAAVVLVNNGTETEWFQTLAAVSSAVCFPRGRIKFWSPGKDSATPLQGQAVLYAGTAVEAFQRRFAAFGVIATLEHAEAV